MGLKLEHESESLGGLVKIQMAEAPSQVSSSKSLGGAPEDLFPSISKSDADAAIWDKLWTIV